MPNQPPTKEQFAHAYNELQKSIDVKNELIARLMELRDLLMLDIDAIRDQQAGIIMQLREMDEGE